MPIPLNKIYILTDHAAERKDDIRQPLCNAAMTLCLMELTSCSSDVTTLYL
ncbi:hypothetical protein MCHI_004019 [Candidatus Magnetoovum chiemensis]|nr:hypothetical protein MCHI_004019 [Candidatus Magnetoovum chiemensis]